MTDKSSETVSGGNEAGASAPSALPLRKPPHQATTTTERLRLYSNLSTNEAIAQLGDPDLGDARSSSATLELDSVTSNGPTSPAKHRRLKVDVTLSVSNDGSCPPPPGTPVLPCPPPGHNPNPPCRPFPCSSSRWPWIVVVLLVLVLILVGLNHLGQKDNGSANGVYSGTSDSTTQTTTVDANQAPSLVPNSPTIVRLDDTVMPGNTVILNQVGDAVCDGLYHPLNQVPDFAIVHTQNWVNNTATQWQLRCVENLGGATVVALDASHNVINRQIYGANNHFEEQLTFVQSTDAAGFRTVQVDFYAPFNTFIGRTIYRFDSSNRVSDAYRQDGFQRPLQASHFTRDRNGLITSVTTEKTPRNGGGRNTAYTKSDIEASTRVFYAFDSFN
jgi:hypothetical protein